MPAKTQTNNLQATPTLPIGSNLSNHNIERNIVRLTLQRASPAHLIRDTDGHRHFPRLAKRSERPVVVPTAISKPIPIGIKPNTRHKQQIRRNHVTGSRLMNAMRADPHGHISRPDMKLKRPIPASNHRKARAPRTIAIEPRDNDRSNIELP